MSLVYKKRNGQKKATRVMWNDDEDKKLILIVKQNGANQDTWKKAAEQLDGRNIKQCRERWCNQLDPSVKKGQWTPEEEELIIKLQQEIGNKWSQIASKLVGRTDNSVKNHWHGTLKQRVIAGSLHNSDTYTYHSIQKIREIVASFSSQKQKKSAKAKAISKKNRGNSNISSINKNGFVTATSSSTAKNTPRKPISTNRKGMNNKNANRSDKQKKPSTINTNKNDRSEFSIMSMATASASAASNDDRHAKKKKTSRTCTKKTTASSVNVNRKKKKLNKGGNCNGASIKGNIGQRRSSSFVVRTGKRKRAVKKKIRSVEMDDYDCNMIIGNVGRSIFALHEGSIIKRNKLSPSISPQMPIAKTISLSPPMISESLSLFPDYQTVGETMGVDSGTVFLPIENGGEVYRTPTPGLTDFSIKSSTPIRGVDSWDNVGILFNDQKRIMTPPRNKY
jgi:hypothetical protein